MDGQTQQKPLLPVTVASDLTGADLRAALAAGWRDFMAHPAYGLFFAAFYAIGGAVILYGLSTVGEGWWLVPIMAGFPILAPFAAVGLYEVSRRRQLGLPMRWGSILGALRGRGDDQLMMMGGLVFIAFSFWMGMAHGIFAIFMGESGLGAQTASLTLSPNVLLMLLVGGVVGALFALALFAITVMSLPMLVDQETDFISAIIVSLGTIRANKRVMMTWAIIIAVTLLVAMVPLFLGLFIALPVLGHATWHLYQRVVGH